MRVLVIGATGKVGSHAVTALTGAGHEVTALARRPGVRIGVRSISADLVDADAIEAAAKGQDAAFLITPNVEQEVSLALGAIAALEAAGISRLIYLGVNNAEARRAVPHFGFKVEIAHALASSRIATTTLAAGYFFQNDAPTLPAIRSGVYPTPLGNAGVASVDVRDIADALVTTLSDEQYVGREVPVLSPDVMTGPGNADIWSAILGRPVRYAGDDTSGFAQALQRAGATPWLIDDLRQMLRFGQQHGNRANEEQLASARQVIGHEPRRYRDFAAELAT